MRRATPAPAALVLAAVAGCSVDGARDADAGAAPDAGDDATPSLWYRDLDRDGHGDPAIAVLGVARPAGHIALGDDCDDRPPGGTLRYPGAPERCDGVDNDCAPATADVCLDGCRPFLRAGGHRYLFCHGPVIQAVAALVCAHEGFDPVRVDDAGENTYLWSQAGDGGFAPPLFLGATRTSSDDTWRWTLGGDAFDVDGVPVDGAYTNWGSTGLPGFDCAVLATVGNVDARWAPTPCATQHAFVCERPAPDPEEP
jgi:hypothetical protein